MIWKQKFEGFGKKKKGNTKPHNILFLDILNYFFLFLIEENKCLDSYGYVRAG